MADNPEQEVSTVETDVEEEVIEHDTDLKDRVTDLEANQGLLQLLSDPQIAAVIEAKKAGKTVKVSTEEVVPDPTLDAQVDDITKDLDDDDPNRGLLTSLSKLIDEKLSAQDERITAVEEHAQGSAQKEISTAVAAARSKFKDFDTYKSEIVSLSKANPNLGLEELYMIAKVRSGDLDITKTETHTEKPTVVQPSRRTAATKKENPRRGKKGFTAMLAEALEKIPDEGLLS